MRSGACPAPALQPQSRTHALQSTPPIKTMAREPGQMRINRAGYVGPIQRRCRYGREA